MGLAPNEWKMAHGEMGLTEVAMSVPPNEMGVPPGEMEVLMNQDGAYLNQLAPCIKQWLGKNDSRHFKIELFGGTIEWCRAVLNILDFDCELSRPEKLQSSH